MQTNSYAKTVKQASRLGFGAWQLGSVDTWGHMSIEAGVDLVQYAISKGITFFDTAPNYAQTRSEQILGMSLSSIREQVIINTKLGHLTSGRLSFQLEDLEASLEGSLQRLQTDYLDSVVLHNPPKEILLGETNHYNQLKEWKRQGKILAFGVSIDTPQELKWVLEANQVDCIELLYNVFFQASRCLMEEVKSKNISVIVKVPLDSGWLSGKYDETAKFDGIRSRFTKEQIARRSQLVKQLKAITQNEDILSYSLAFLLHYDWVTTIIPGSRNQRQIDQLVQASQIQMSKELHHQYEQFYDEWIQNNPLPW